MSRNTRNMAADVIVLSQSSGSKMFIFSLVLLISGTGAQDVGSYMDNGVSPMCNDLCHSVFSGESPHAIGICSFGCMKMSSMLPEHYGDADYIYEMASYQCTDDCKAQNFRSHNEYTACKVGCKVALDAWESNANDYEEEEISEVVPVGMLPPFMQQIVSSMLGHVHQMLVPGPPAPNQQKQPELAAMTRAPGTDDRRRGPGFFLELDIQPQASHRRGDQERHQRVSAPSSPRLIPFGPMFEEFGPPPMPPAGPFRPMVFPAGQHGPRGQAVSVSYSSVVKDDNGKVTVVEEPPRVKVFNFGGSVDANGEGSRPRGGQDVFGPLPQGPPPALSRLMNALLFGGIPRQLVRSLVPVREPEQALETETEAEVGGLVKDLIGAEETLVNAAKDETVMDEEPHLNDVGSEARDIKFGDGEAKAVSDLEAVASAAVAHRDFVQVLPVARELVETECTLCSPKARVAVFVSVALLGLGLALVCFFVVYKYNKRSKKVVEEDLDEKMGPDGEDKVETNLYFIQIPYETDEAGPLPLKLPVKDV